MTVKQHINHEAIQKVVHFYNVIFHSINLCHTFSILLYHLPSVFTKNNKLWYERKEDFLYILLLQRTMLYQRRSKIVPLDEIAFLNKHLCINKPR